jgi:protein-disulfide isomerase
MARILPSLVFAAMAALALGACGSGDEAAPSGEAIAPIAAPAGQQWTETVAITPEGGWLVGNPDAPIKLIEYGSLTCPACAAFSQTGMQPLREKYIDSGRVSWELRSVVIHGAVDLVLTRLLKCAPKEAAPLLAEQLWGNVNAVLDPLQRNAAGLEQAMSLPPEQRFAAYAQQGGLLDFLAARGISVDQGSQCLSDAAAIEALAAEMQAQATKDEVGGTPTFFVNGALVDGITWADLKPVLQRAGAR